MVAEAKEINNRINILWKWIKAHDIPSQADTDAWDAIVDDTEKLREYTSGSDPLNVLFRSWLVSYLQYMSDVSKGVPTLMQECNQIIREGKV